MSKTFSKRLFVATASSACVYASRHASLRAVMHQVKFHVVQSDADSQTPPVGSPSDYRWISDAVYAREAKKDSANTTLAQSYLDSIADNLEMHYEVLQGRLFEGHGTQISHFQQWNVILVKQTPKDSQQSDAEPNYIIGFEGTSNAGDWLAGISSFFNDVDDELLNEMNVEIKKWIKKHDIEAIHALTGHSSGCMFVKNVFGEDDLKSLQDPWMITLKKKSQA